MGIFKKQPNKEKKNESLTLKKVSHWIERPWLSEKATDLKEANAYVFKTRLDAGKTEIKKEIEARYGVRVQGVRVIRRMGKAKRFGKHVGHRANTKKAIVKLQKGDTIDII
ncbi:MAG: 50S ribosomal protein L23 [Patescibacteria group bacterium]